MTAPLAVTIGDPAGIGPEIIAAAWQAREALGLPPFVVVGGRRQDDEFYYYYYYYFGPIKYISSHSV